MIGFTKPRFRVMQRKRSNSKRGDEINRFVGGGGVGRFAASECKGTLTYSAYSLVLLRTLLDILNRCILSW